MSYGTIYQCVNDQVFVGRVQAAAAQEGDGNPILAADSLRWPVAAASDIEAAYASALAAGNENPGGDEGVITDGMILSAVQAHSPAPP
jgi:hypothetical protein